MKKVVKIDPRDPTKTVKSNTEEKKKIIGHTQHALLGLLGQSTRQL